MTKDEQVRTAIAQQASEWFALNDQAPLDPGQSATFVTWLQGSPAHVEEFLGVAAVARDLQSLAATPEFSVDSLLARARGEDQSPARSAWFPLPVPDGRRPQRRWQTAALAALVLAAAIGGLQQWPRLWGGHREMSGPPAQALNFRTGHGEVRTFTLPDNSVLHLNTDSEVTAHYDANQRLIILDAGEAALEVVHEPQRSFRVLAGRAEVIDLGTRFDVRLYTDSTVVTVSEGKVSVAPTAEQMQSHGSAQPRVWAPVILAANQQVRVEADHWPPALANVDPEHTTAWLRRQISFDHEPLGLVAAEFNRYAPKPIEITSPALRDLKVSGVFSTDDPEEIVAFLRSLDGVRVEVTASQIRVSRK
ncbi:MAG: FecR domain-containing protein [Proteobacteria bacterium]|nr:FecR domain-containing protein [Pseudomonadota bacterium]